MKRWIIAGIVFVAISAFFLPQAATDTHFFLLRDMSSVTLNPIKAWSTVLSEARVLKFYCAYAALFGFSLLWLLIGSSHMGFKSKMQRITPDIATPCAEGQGQFGTAKWMQPGDIKRFFSHWKPARRQPWFKELIAAGKESYQEVKKSNVQLD